MFGAMKYENLQNQKKSVKITCFLTQNVSWLFTYVGVIYEYEKEISVEAMQKIVDANEKLIKEIKNNEIHG